VEDYRIMYSINTQPGSKIVITVQSRQNAREIVISQEMINFTAKINILVVLLIIIIVDLIILLLYQLARMFAITRLWRIKTISRVHIQCKAAIKKEQIM
jgi:hypothetical protein